MWVERIYPKKELSTLGSGVTLTDLFNPISGRDASHHFFISIEPKEGCTNHVWEKYELNERNDVEFIQNKIERRKVKI